MAKKAFKSSSTHQIALGIFDDGTNKHVMATYWTGATVYGASIGAHPETVLSVKDQDAVVWTAEYPFMVEINPAPPGSLFFRSGMPWYAVQGNDGLYRVHSGSMNPLASGFLPPAGMHFKYKVTRLVAAPTLAVPAPAADPGFNPLDPHLVTEP